MRRGCKVTGLTLLSRWPVCLSIVSNEERGVGLKERLGRAYEWFLTLPRPLVLTILWLAGVALVGLCALALYLVWQALRAGA